MVEIEVDGKVYHPSPNCTQKKCPSKSAARLVEVEEHEGKRRTRDLCSRHALVMVKHYPDDVEVVATWGGLSIEDFG